MATPIVEDEIKRFVVAWYRALDIHASVEDCAQFLADSGLEMIFPEKTLHGMDDFRAWYAGGKFSDGTTGKVANSFGGPVCSTRSPFVIAIVPLITSGGVCTIFGFPSDSCLSKINFLDSISGPENRLDMLKRGRKGPLHQPWRYILAFQSARSRVFAIWTASATRISE